MDGRFQVTKCVFKVIMHMDGVSEMDEHTIKKNIQSSSTGIKCPALSYTLLSVDLQTSLRLHTGITYPARSDMPWTAMFSGTILVR